MDELYDVITLKSSSSFVTQADNDSFDSILVYSGSVRVFVTWVKGENQFGRRVLLTEVPAGISIPENG